MQGKCENENRIPSSPQIGQTYEINRRLIFAMRLIGVGYQGICNVCCFMDIGTGFGNKSYYNIIDNIWISAKSVTELVFRKAVEEEKVKK